MGWDSELSINGHLVGMWRKHAPPYPALLFQSSDVVITQATGSDDEISMTSVVWCTSSVKALSNLAASGFSWNHLLRDYTESRDWSIELGFLQGRLMSRLDEAQYESFMAEVNQHRPADDLRMLAEALEEELRVLTRSWNDDGRKHASPTPLRDHLFFAGDQNGHRPELPQSLPHRDRYILTRATDYFLRSAHAAPFVGWAFTLVEVLHHVDPAARIEFDISGGLPDSSFESGVDYADQYWKSSRADLADTARFYGSVFAGLSQATADIGRAAQFGRLETLLAATEAPELSSAEKGQRLEELVGAILDLPETRLPVLEKRLKRADEELDLVLRNDLEEPFWRAFNSPVIIVECKNWSSHVDVTELRVLETKIRDRQRLCSVGLFVALHGFTKPFLERVRDLHAHGLTVFPVSRTDICEMLALGRTLPQWLCEHGLRRIL